MNTRWMTISAAAAIMALGMSACEKKGGAGTGGSAANNLKNQAAAFVDEAKTKAMDSIKKQMTDLKGQIVRLEQTPNDFEGAAQAAYDQTIVDLNNQHVKLTEKFEELKGAGKDAWTAISKDMEDGLKKLADAVKAAQAKYAK